MFRLVQKELNGNIVIKGAEITPAASFVQLLPTLRESSISVARDCRDNITADVIAPSFRDNGGKR